MIRFNLRCQKSHEFEAWFKNSEAFEQQSVSRKVVCPQCGSKKVTKALMAPSISTSRFKQKKDDKVESRPMAKMLESDYRNAVRKIRQHIVENSEYVGDRFTEEARKIHYEEAEKRGIYGEANSDDVAELIDEGIDVMPIPDNPDDNN